MVSSSINDHKPQNTTGTTTNNQASLCNNDKTRFAPCFSLHLINIIAVAQRNYSNNVGFPIIVVILCL